MVTRSAYLAVGSNLGDRAENLRRAVELVRLLPGTRVASESRLIETAPLGPAPQGSFLNGVIAVETSLPPEELLAGLKRIEKRIGRRERERWGPREVDLDIILYGDAVIETETLCVPHPRFRERRFVLEPLAEVAPQARDPVTGRTASELAAACRAAALSQGGP